MRLIPYLLLSTWLSAQGVGIGISTPTERLHIQGNLRLDGAFMPGNNPGLSGQVLTSRGPGIPPTWRAMPSGWILWAVDAWNPSSTTSLGWSCTGCGGSSPWLSNCGSNLRMLGGYNICGAGCYFEKTFTGLPTHSEVYVELSYISLDSWDQNGCCGHDNLQISIDGVVRMRCYPAASYGDPGVQRTTDASVCGANGWQDIGPLECSAYALHNATNLTLRISSGVDQGAGDESLGILSVKIYIK
jgi:hypothetical protein